MPSIKIFVFFFFLIIIQKLISFKHISAMGSIPMKWPSPFVELMVSFMVVADHRAIFSMGSLHTTLIVPKSTFPLRPRSKELTSLPKGFCWKMLFLPTSCSCHVVLSHFGHLDPILNIFLQQGKKTKYTALKLDYYFSRFMIC